ncbi:endonuclease domain-containing protein [Microbacterium sp. bgisy203]|uniref:endonuclease domain-containing protein n=1 Tax=Microbacterium sp. bgisy203 TaxID=3413799 RepID=UPI003D75BCFB
MIPTTPAVCPSLALSARGHALVASVAAAGGVARASRLRAEGHSPHHIARAVAAGALERVRRDWVALPGADAELVSAARAGVVLSCISLARRLGLWVATEDRCHVAADPGAAGGKPERAAVHWARPVVPREPDALVDRIENALLLVAACQPVAAAVAVWDSAVHRRLITVAELSRLRLPPAARSVLARVDPLSESGLETLFRTALRWLRLRILTQVFIGGHRVDFLIGDRLVVQIDGGHHVGAQRASDVAHDAALTLMGYHVLRFTYTQIVDDWPAVQDAIQRAVAQGLHLSR